MMSLAMSYYHAASKQELLFAVIALEVFFIFPFMICSFVVSSTANAGFNCVLTGFLNLALAGGSYQVIKTSKAPIAIGFLLGSTLVMALLNFMTAVFWGQLSNCKKISGYGTLAGYSCSDTAAYVTLYLWKNDFIVESGGYDDSEALQNNARTTSGGFTYAAPPLNPPQYVHPTATSADL